MKFQCPKCLQSASSDSLEHNSLAPIAWTNGCNSKYNPRLLHDVNSNVLLLSRIYSCKCGHEVYGHHPKLIENELVHPFLPFLLWHSTGFTLSFVDYVEQSSICSGASMQQCEKVFQQNRVSTLFLSH